MENYENALGEILSKIAKKIPKEAFPINAYIAGGVAVYLYTKVRVSDDVDLIINNKIDEFPKDLFVEWIEDTQKRKLYYDYNYNPTLGLMHEDYELRAKYYKTFNDKFKVYLLHPIDLIISKILRFEENDEQDIKALSKHFQLDKEELVRLANDAISVGVGFREETAKQHLEWVMEILQ